MVTLDTYIDKNQHYIPVVTELSGVVNIVHSVASTHFYQRMDMFKGETKKETIALYNKGLKQVDTDLGEAIKVVFLVVIFASLSAAGFAFNVSRVAQ